MFAIDLKEGAVVWWWSYACTLMCMLLCWWLFIISNMSSGYGEYNNVLTNLSESYAQVAVTISEP